MAPAPARLAADLATLLPLAPPAVALLAPGHTPRAFFDALCAAGLTADALRFLALALPKPDAVWWGCRCSETRPVPAVHSEAAAVAAADRWACTPTEGHRRAAGRHAEEAGWGTAGGSLAAAAWLSGPSLSPPDLPVVHPREDLTAQAVAGTLFLLAALEPLTAAAAERRFLTLGRQIAAGETRRPEACFP